MSSLISLREHDAAGGFAGEDARAFGASDGVSGHGEATDGDFETLEELVNLRI
jgi:hypothetical protein